MGTLPRCLAPHPTLQYETGQPVSCNLDAGHDGTHFDSFAGRVWNDEPVHHPPAIRDGRADCATCGESVWDPIHATR